MIKIQMLGLPCVTVDDRRVVFPYKKCEALFYYIACESRTSREEACALLWEDENEETAKKNLRHALYTIKKAFDCDMIISPVKSSLAINPNMDIDIDIKHFFNGENVSVYDGDFLRGFVVKNAVSFTQWMENKEEQVRSFYLTGLLKSIQLIPCTEIPSAEALAAKYMEKDPLDERVYEAMMRKYDAAGLYHKGLELYKKLYKTLNDEIGVDPNHAIQELYYSMLNHWSANEQPADPEENAIKGYRQAETNELKNIYDSFLNGKTDFVLISGESGVGKSYLLNEFVQNVNSEQVSVFRAPSFSIEKNNPLQTWNFLLMQIDEFIEDNSIQIPPHYVHAIARLFPAFGMSVADDIDISTQSEVGGNYGYLAAKNCIIRTFSLISKTKKLILIFDDLQYMDSMSLDLLTSLILSQNNRILIIASCQDEVNTITEQFISAMIKNNMLRRIILKRFTYEEARLYIEKELSNLVTDDETIRQIYDNTEGIPFFLAEVISDYRVHGLNTTFSKNSQSILNDVLNCVSPEARQLIDVLSIFRHSVTLDMLLFILNKTESDILHITDDFRYGTIVEEHMENGRVVFSFKHNKMHEFVYDKLLPSKKRILHNRAGYAYEAIYASNMKPYYKRIAYHFRLGENPAKALEYEILSLEQNTNLIFDLYPVLESKASNKSLSPDSIETEFDKAERNLYALKSGIDTKVFYLLEARLLHARSSYYVLRGKYEDGVKYAHKLLSSPYVAQAPLLMIKCIRTMIYYGIQTDNTEIMKKYIDMALPILNENTFHDEEAILYRLMGLYEIMCDRPNEAMPLLEKSVDMLEKYESNISVYSLNIAAAFNYMGEAKRKSKDFESAVKYYHTAISNCEKNDCIVNPTFYTNMALSYYDGGNKDKAYELFISALSLYDSSTVLMKRAIAKSYAAEYYCNTGNIAEAAKCLNDADYFSEMLGSPSERKIYTEVCGRLKSIYDFKNV